MASVLHHNSGILIPRHELEELTEAMATVFRIGSRFTPRLIERLDLADGDPDLEGECSEDEISRCDDIGRPVRANGPGCEISDPGGVHDEDGVNTLFAYDLAGGAGCPIADPGGCQHDGREPDEGV
jgi:hypothetical protein